MNDAAFQDVLFWGVIFVILIIVLFLASRFFSWWIGSRVKDRSTVFGMDLGDVESLRKKGGISPEEEKAIRAAMSRRMLERVKEEDKIRNLPPKAAVVLGAIDAETAKQMKAAGDPGILPKPIAAVAPPVKEDKLPPEFDLYLEASDMELENLLQAGFLSDSDVSRIRRARRRP
ncbi:hypothetical protein GC173_14455 [bacterium]|nr:hypothetical protein [bacterium]